MWVAGELSGASGISVTDMMAFQSWILRFSQASASLKEEMAACMDWLENKSPPRAAYRAIMAARLVALEKCPEVRLVGISEVLRRLFAKFFHQAGGVQAKDAL